MGTAILRSQDCLCGRFPMTLGPRAAASSRRSPNFSSANPNRGPYGSQSRRRRRSSVAVAQSDRSRMGGVDRRRAMVAKAPGKRLVMEQVKILKRGESLSPHPPQTAATKTKRGGRGGDRKPRARSVESSGPGSVSDLALGSTDRLGPDPETVQKQIKAAEFNVIDAIYAGSGAYYASRPPSSVPLPAFLGKNGAATSDLRRLLGLGSV